MLAEVYGLERALEPQGATQDILTRNMTRILSVQPDTSVVLLLSSLLPESPDWTASESTLIAGIQHSLHMHNPFKVVQMLLSRPLHCRPGRVSNLSQL